MRQAGERRPGAAVSPRDKAAAHRIAATVLRRAGSLDAVLEPFLRRDPPPAVRHALRIGAAELLLLGTPRTLPSAAPWTWCRSPSPGW
ncbi:transcription antitermination factor NusB [Siccirubricoccus deserti]